MPIGWTFYFCAVCLAAPVCALPHFSERSDCDAENDTSPADSVLIQHRVEREQIAAIHSLKSNDTTHSISANFGNATTSSPPGNELTNLWQKATAGQLTNFRAHDFTQEATAGKLLHGCYFKALVFTVPIATVVLLVLFSVAASVKIEVNDVVTSPSLPCNSSEQAQEQQQQQQQQQPDLPLPRLLLSFVVCGNVLLQANYSIVMPASIDNAREAGQGVILSGFVIGSYAIGAILSLPLMVHLSRVSYRTALLFMSVAGIAGNALYAESLNRSVPALMILARTVCGAEAGAVVAMQNIVLRCSSGHSRFRAMSAFVFASSLGLALGPVLSSFGRSLASNRGYDPDTAPAIFMVLLASLFLLATLVAFPASQRACFELASAQHEDLEPQAQPSYVYTSWQLQVAWMNVLMQILMMAIRYFQRVVWEAGALYLLAEGYGLGTDLAGYLIPVCIVGLLALPFWSEWLSHVSGPTYIVMFVDTLEVVGLLMMFEVPIDSELTRCSLFLCGSAFFYFGNWAQSIPLTAMRPDFSLPSHPWLSIEACSALVWGGSFAFCFYAPVVSRITMKHCLNQNVLVVMLWVMFLGSAPAVAYTVSVLMKVREKFIRERSKAMATF